MAIAPKFERLSEEQQNDARVAVQNFIRRHDISDWSVQVNVRGATTGKFSVRIRNHSARAIRITEMARTGNCGSRCIVRGHSRN